jgi:Uma2 family endonuclease
MTSAELMCFRDDGIDRWLIKGELRSRRWEHRTPATGLAVTNLGNVLSTWARDDESNRGVALIDAYHRIARHPDTTLGIDVSLISKHQWIAARHRPFVEGCPILAVKVITPFDSHGDVVDAVQEYLVARVKIVWIVHPDFESVAVYRSDAEPVSFNRQQELTAEPHLPGFRVRVAELFE